MKSDLEMQWAYSQRKDKGSKWQKI